jgi:deoxyribodipyrimidine photo-lyase
VVTSAWVGPQLGGIAACVAAALPLQVLEPEPFVDLPEPLDLRRYSRYWRSAGPLLRLDLAPPKTPT